VLIYEKEGKPQPAFLHCMTFFNPNDACNPGGNAGPFDRANRPCCSANRAGAASLHFRTKNAVRPPALSSIDRGGRKPAARFA